MGKSLDRYDKKFEIKSREIQEVRKRVDDLGKITADVSMLQQKLKEGKEEVWDLRRDIEKNYATLKDIDICHNELTKRVLQTEFTVQKTEISEIKSDINKIKGLI